MIIKKLLFSLLIIISISPCVQAQVSIGGIINRYYPVTAFSISIGPCANPTTLASVTVGPGYGAPTPALAVGMNVLIIQMQAGTSGVANRTTSSLSYGDFTNAGGAGNYEFATIATVSGSVITFTKQLVNTYDVAGKIQIIPTFPSGAPWNAISTSNYTTSAVLTALPYDKLLGVGGVFVLETTGAIAMGHDLTIDAMGFQGGDTIGNAYSAVWPPTHIQTACCASLVSGGGIQMDATNAPQYAYPLVLSEPRSGTECGITTNRIIKGARKGQGIFGNFTGEELSKGKIANGGGGAHGFNSGGGGGGGYNGGGNGGYEHEWACNSSVSRPAGLDHGGRGGLGLQGGSIALFMGGGGGAGQGDGNTQTIAGLTTGGYATGDFRGPTSGGDGGGIVIIKASQIVASGSRSMSAKGGAGGYATSDGAGGGGGGGSIILEVPAYSGILTLDASGGNGGYAINPNSSDCHGPGGGGGGGRILLSVGATPAGVTLNTNAGPPGRLLQRTGSSAGDYLFDKTTFCGADIFWGAGVGAIGTITYNAFINTQACSLPVTLITIYAELLIDNTVALNWKTASEINSSLYIVERSADGKDFKEIGKIPAAGKSQQIMVYSFSDEEAAAFSGSIYYRLRMVDLDGTFEYSKTVVVNLKGTIVSVFPNPLEEGEDLTIVYHSNIESEQIKTDLVDMLGRHLYSQVINLNRGSNAFNLSMKGLTTGIYFIYLSDSYGKTIKKIIIQ